MQRSPAVLPVSSGERKSLTWTPAVPPVSSGGVHHLAKASVAVRYSCARILQHLQGDRVGGASPNAPRLCSTFRAVGSWAARAERRIATVPDRHFEGIRPSMEAARSGTFSESVDRRLWRARARGAWRRSVRCGRTTDRTFGAPSREQAPGVILSLLALPDRSDVRRGRRANASMEKGVLGIRGRERT
jgi:hypothetical protein